MPLQPLKEGQPQGRSDSGDLGFTSQPSRQHELLLPDDLVPQQKALIKEVEAQFGSLSYPLQRIDTADMEIPIYVAGIGLILMSDSSRRGFLKKAAIVVTGLTFGGVAGELYRRSQQAKQEEQPLELPYLTPENPGPFGSIVISPDIPQDRQQEVIKKFLNRNEIKTDLAKVSADDSVPGKPHKLVVAEDGDKALYGILEKDDEKRGKSYVYVSDEGSYRIPVPIGYHAVLSDTGKILILPLMFKYTDDWGRPPTATPAVAPPDATKTHTPAATATHLATITFTPTPTATSIRTPTAVWTPTPTETEVPRPLPELYVDGPYLKRRNTGGPVLLKGVNMTTFDWSWNPTVDTKKLIMKAKSWGANFVRLGIDVVTTPQLFMSNLDEVVDWCDAQGIYVYLNPFRIENYPGSQQPDLPNEQVLTFMRDVAARYKNKTNIIYGLYNEPGGVTWEEWWPWAINISTAIRGSNPKAILAVPGTAWSRDFRYLQTHPFPFDNVIYDVHDYSWPGQDIRPWWTWMVQNHLPIIVGEFGGGQPGNQDVCPYQSPCDIDYMRDTLAIVSGNPNQLQYAAWQMEPVEGGLTLPSGELTNRGELIKSDLATYPPTLFRGTSRA
ncbi:twin-arginine translocation signal domain-containing protein [Candidatus Gottesmanbacteria bacterium]|nr:twin-arginine translocation signal domain-containing protein [Candidatus Gottesmanbacteria bacterium]